MCSLLQLLGELALAVMHTIHLMGKLALGGLLHLPLARTATDIRTTLLVQL